MQTDTKPVRIDVIIPAYNEAEGIQSTYERLDTVFKSINLDANFIFIDDGSRDTTWQILSQIATNDPRVKLIRFSRNFGHQAAIVAGLAHSISDYNLIIDSDLQDPPELIERILPLTQQGYDVVYGVRTSREGETPLKKATAKLFYQVINIFTPFPIPIDAGDFRLVSAKARNFFLQAHDKARLNREIWSWVGLRQIGLPYERPARKFGTTKYNYKRMFKLAFDGLTTSRIGLLILPPAAGLLMLFISLLLALARHNVSASLFFTAGLMLFGLTIFGLYISRLYHQLRHRPTYLIAEIISSAEENRLRVHLR